VGDGDETGDSRSTRRLLVTAGVTVVVFAADQLTKWGIDRWLGYDRATHRRDLFGEFVALEYTRNRGIAFGLFQGQTIWVALVAAVVLILAIRAYRSLVFVPRLIAIGGGLVAGGALGNLLDRIRLGYVIDFIAIGSWPNFNVADSALTIGAVLIAWQMVRDEPSVTRAEKASAIQV